MHKRKYGRSSVKHAEIDDFWFEKENSDRLKEVGGSKPQAAAKTSLSNDYPFPSSSMLSAVISSSASASAASSSSSSSSSSS